MKLLNEMKLLNLCCGGHRPGEPWTNVDDLHNQLAPGTPERINLDKETNYYNVNVLGQSLPFSDYEFDGILAQHCLEHFTCHETTTVLSSCTRVLKKGGVLVASVPNVSYFRNVHGDDDRANAVALFGESISGDWGDSQCKSFFEYALWHREHKQILNEDGLWAILRRAGFAHQNIGNHNWSVVPSEIKVQLNRPRFSTLLYAIK